MENNKTLKEWMDLYTIANEHRLAMSEEINELKAVNRIETEANEKLRKGYHRLVKDNRKLKSLLKKVFEAMPSESDFGTDLCNEIKSIL